MHYSVNSNLGYEAASLSKQIPNSAAKKTDTLQNKDYNFSGVINSSATVFFDLFCLQQLFSLLQCKECSSVGSIQIIQNEEKRRGFALCFLLHCTMCGWKSEDHYSSKKCGQCYEVNRRAVYAYRQIGCGHAEATKFSYLMNMPPPPTTNAYQQHVSKLCETITERGTEIMRIAGYEVRNSTGDHCAVSVDGTWHRRGFSSLSGVVTAISVSTGKVLDVEVLTKECTVCRMHKKNEDLLQQQVWEAEHKPVCSTNYHGSSPNMVVVGAQRIFMRSKDFHGLQYTKFLGDGDSKSFKKVCEIDPYRGIKIEKLECIGHYQKRLGTALRKLTKEKKLGGKGKLTATLIDKMQNYFGIALRENCTSVEKMEKSIWATLYHLAASDSRPIHGNCPEGPSSWCSYNRAKSEKKLATYKHRYGLSYEILQHVKPIYKRLTAPEMLQKCLHGKTQNVNECFNSTIWRRCPRDTFVGHKTIKLCVMDAVCHFNAGALQENEH